MFRTTFNFSWGLVTFTKIAEIFIVSTPILSFLRLCKTLLLLNAQSILAAMILTPYTNGTTWRHHLIDSRAALITELYMATPWTTHSTAFTLYIPSFVIFPLLSSLSLSLKLRIIYFIKATLILHFQFSLIIIIIIN